MNYDNDDMSRHCRDKCQDKCQDIYWNSVLTEMGALCLSFRRRKLLRYNCGMDMDRGMTRLWIRAAELLTAEQQNILASALIDAMAGEGWGGVEIQTKRHGLHSVVIRKSVLPTSASGFNGKFEADQR